jgi:hypothetical protein
MPFGEFLRNFKYCHITHSNVDAGLGVGKIVQNQKALPLREFLMLFRAFAVLESSGWSARPSVSMEQLGFHWKDFHKIWNSRILKNLIYRPAVFFRHFPSLHSNFRKRKSKALFENDIISITFTFQNLRRSDW